MKNKMGQNKNVISKNPECISLLIAFIAKDSSKKRDKNNMLRNIKTWLKNCVS